MEYLLTIVQKLGIFIVLAQTILHFRANDSYEKYIRILTNIMILSLIIVPILAIFQKDIPQEMRIRVQKYQQRILESESRMADDMETEETEQLLEKQIVEQLQGEIKYKLNNCDVPNMNGEYTVENVEITGMKAYEKPEKNKLKLLIRVIRNREKEKTVEQIGQVEIEKITIGKKKQTTAKEDDLLILQKEYAKLLEIDETCVEVR